MVFFLCSRCAAKLYWRYIILTSIVFLFWHLGIWAWEDCNCRCCCLVQSFWGVCFVLWFLFPVYFLGECGDCMLPFKKFFLASCGWGLLMGGPGKMCFWVLGDDTYEWEWASWLKAQEFYRRKKTIVFH